MERFLNKAPDFSSEMKIPEEAVIELIKEEIGEDVIPLVRLIFAKENVSEFKIAEKLGITVNQVRSILYRLQEKNLVTFTRKKDKQKGWYIYSWTLDMREVRFLLLSTKRSNLEHLQKMLELEKSGSFFQCNNKCMKLSFENALEFQFKCPECGEILNQGTSDKTVNSMTKEVEKLKQEIELYSIPDYDLEEEKLEKKPAKKKEVKRKEIRKKIRVARKRHRPKKTRKARHKPRPAKRAKPKKKSGFLRRIFRR
ncbi:MAG: hypothetical protein AABW87_00070 [Nanoarchaeota archaeon]